MQLYCIYRSQLVVRCAPFAQKVVIVTAYQVFAVVVELTTCGNP